MREKRFCPKCGEELINLGFNFDTANIDFECPECDWYGTDSTALTEEEAEKMLNEEYETCIECGNECLVHSDGNYECQVCGHSGWVGETKSEYLEGDSDTRTGEIFDNYYK